MGYTELKLSGANSTAIREYLSKGDTVAITIRIPKNLRDSAKEAAVLRGTTLSALIRESIICDLAKEK